MGILVNPAAALTTGPATNTSTDGHLKVTAATNGAGVYLEADFSGASPQPVQVRFFRADDDSLVRSGDPAWAPAGQAIAFDHEAHVGLPAAYYARPVTSFGGSSGTRTGVATVTTTEPTGLADLWLKSPGNPALSILVDPEDPPEETYTGRTVSTTIVGDPRPASSWDVHSASTFSLVIVTNSGADNAVLLALMDTGPILLQTRAGWDFPERYALPGDVVRTRVARMGGRLNRWSVGFTQCRRPATLDAPLRIPGNSWDTLVDRFDTWSAVSAAVGSWRDLVVGV